MGAWKRHTLDADTTYCWRLGLLELWVERVAEEWRAAFRTKREVRGVAAAADEKHATGLPSFAVGLPRPDELAWNRVAVSGASGDIEVMPAMPNRSLVVRPEAPFVLPRKATVSLYVSIPAWVKLTVPVAEPITIAEIPTVVLSNTWYGTPASGELCYSLFTRARRSLSDGLTPPHRIICPVTVVNSSLQDVQFARLRLPVGSLGIYEGPGCLVTSGVDVTYVAEEEVPRTRLGSGPPKLEGAGALVAQARANRPESVLSRGLTTIRSLTGL